MVDNALAVVLGHILFLLGAQGFEVEHHLDHRGYAVRAIGRGEQPPDIVLDAFGNRLFQLQLLGAVLVGVRVLGAQHFQTGTPVDHDDIIGFHAWNRIGSQVFHRLHPFRGQLEVLPHPDGDCRRSFLLFLLVPYIVALFGNVEGDVRILNPGLGEQQLPHPVLHLELEGCLLLQLGLGEPRVVEEEVIVRGGRLVAGAGQLKGQRLPLGCRYNQLTLPVDLRIHLPLPQQRINLLGFGCGHPREQDPVVLRLGVEHNGGSQRDQQDAGRARDDAYFLLFGTVRPKSLDLFDPLFQFFFHSTCPLFSFWNTIRPAST